MSVANSIKKGIAVVGDWVRKNPASAAVVATAVGLTARQAVRTVASTRRRKDAQLTVYDPTLRTNLRLKHPLNTNQAVELATRIKGGESNGEALAKMGLLK